MSDGRDDYLDQIRDAAAAGRAPAGDVTVAAVYHDSWCALLTGRGACNCSPEVRLVPASSLLPKRRPKPKRRKKGKR
jgi:hypothetical protein